MIARWSAVLLFVATGCGPPGPMDVGSRANYVDEGATLTSTYDGATPKVEMEKRGDRWFVTVFQGRQPSGGHAIRVERVIGVGTAARIRARFTVPSAGTETTSITTSPAHSISFQSGWDAVYLYDQDDRLRAEYVRR